MISGTLLPLGDAKAAPSVLLGYSAYAGGNEALFLIDRSRFPSLSTASLHLQSLCTDLFNPSPGKTVNFTTNIGLGTAPSFGGHDRRFALLRSLLQTPPSSKCPIWSIYHDTEALACSLRAVCSLDDALKGGFADLPSIC